MATAKRCNKSPAKKSSSSIHLTSVGSFHRLPIFFSKTAEEKEENQFEIIVTYQSNKILSSVLVLLQFLHPSSSHDGVRGEQQSKITSKAFL
jgi:hypothetical protein